MNIYGSRYLAISMISLFLLFSFNCFAGTSNSYDVYVGDINSDERNDMVLSSKQSWELIGLDNLAATLYANQGLTCGLCSNLQESHCNYKPQEAALFQTFKLSDINNGYFNSVNELSYLIASNSCADKTLIISNLGEGSIAILASIDTDDLIDFLLVGSDVSVYQIR